MAEKRLRTIEFRGLGTTYTIPEVDPTSSVTGDAADAKVVGDHIKDKENPHGVTAEQIGAAPASHATDENNPHNVTIEQIGAAPSGYGLGEAVYSLPANGALTFKFDPFRHVALFTAQGTTASSRAVFLVNTYGNGGVRTNVQVLSGASYITCAGLPEAEQENGVVLFNDSSDAYVTVSVLILQGHYPEVIEGNSGVTSATFQEPIHSGNISAYAAPSGHGLGWAASINTYNGGDLDTLTAPGWYFWDSKDTSTTIAGISSQYWYVHVVAYGDGHLHCRQEIHPTTRNTYSPIVRKCSGSTWGEWSWESPPMNAGVEYRTTMYDNGKALYLQRGDNGAIFYRRNGEDAWYAMASRIDGTFANVVAANPTAQDPATRQLRNSTIVSTETTPSYNGEICWTYE